jgi:ABC-type glycerol-3-phosphate transport system substrate-binding protein
MVVLCCAEQVVKGTSDETSQGIRQTTDVETETNTQTTRIDYSQYLKQVPSKYATQEIVIAGANYTAYEGTEPSIVEDEEKGKSVSLHKDNAISWAFNAPDDGLYQLTVLYYPLAYSGDSIVCDILLDGQIPFAESENVPFERNWVNDNEQKFDIFGNQIRPTQIEQSVWMEKTVTDASGMTEGTLHYYVSAGQHMLSLNIKSEAMLVHSITFSPVEKFRTYAEVKSGYQENGYTAATIDTTRIEAENNAAKSDQSMYPLTDRSSPIVQPYSANKILYNTIGGSQWKTVGQWIEWEIPVEEDGLYQIALHFKQSVKSDAVSIRELYIDGKLPFAEADDLCFTFNSAWQTAALSGKDGTAFQFYLKSGKHTVRLKVGLGEYRSIIEQADQAISDLNHIYREIVVVTGVVPDQYRDYEFEKTIPDVLDEMVEISSNLKDLETEIRALGFSGNQGTDTIKRLYYQLDKMIANPEIISKLLTSYRDNISSLGTWRNQLTEQPLELDCLYLQSPGSALPQGDATVLESLSHYMKQFFYSFTSDYSSIGNMGEAAGSTIKVWMTTGRDQAQLVKQLITDQFTPNTNMNVNLQLVSADSLLPALLADTGPDVSLGLAQADPMNLALRGALVDLSQLDEYATVTERFSSQAIVPFTLNSAVYALPDTLSYMMLFYRKDILGELSIDTFNLDTWDNLLQKVMPVIQKNGLSVGLPCNIQTYLTMFYQAGGSLYVDNDTRSGLGNSEGIQAMTNFIMLYKQYKLPQTFDFANRFRSGEMPIVMGDYLFYNQLTVFAPEIKGLWGMIQVPGTVKKDNTISHATVSTVTGNVIMASTKDLKSSWDFLEWWTSTDIQSEYGRALESVVGSAARYNSANIEAMKTVNWDSDIREQLTLQLAALQCYPEVPGGYLTTRHYDFSVRRILYYGESVRTSLEEAAEDIDMDIAKKRLEYQLN